MPASTWSSAKAGSGKTSALDAAADAWRTAGLPVLGTAVAARAALAFGEQASIPAMTVTRLLASPDKPVAGRPAELARGTVLIVDEAGIPAPAHGPGAAPVAELLNVSATLRPARRCAAHPSRSSHRGR